MGEIHDAAKQGDLAKVTALLEAGADINAKTWFWGSGPLALAVQGGHAEVVKLLLDRGADDKALKQNKDATLASAISHGHIDLVTVLLDHGCGTADDALHFAVHSELPELAAAMLDRGAKVGGKNAAGLTFLMQAAVFKNIELVRVLLDHGAKVTNTNRDGSTPLHFVFTPSKKPPTRELIELLLQHGADINAKMKGTDLTPLWGAWSIDDNNLRLEMIRFLLEKGADINIRLVNAQRVMMEAVSFGKPSEEALLGETLLEATQKTEPDNAALISFLQNWKPQPQTQSPPSPPPAEPKPVQAAPTNTISFQCSSCSKSLKAPIQAAGKTVKCPKCSQPIVVPSS